MPARFRSCHGYRRGDLTTGCAGTGVGIPGVVGTSEATHQIASGDRIQVDGTNGTMGIAAVRRAERHGTSFA
jgi:hypothetical protein